MLGYAKVFIYLEAVLVIGIFVARAVLSEEMRKQLDARMVGILLGLPVIGYLLPGGRFMLCATFLLMIPALARNRADAARLYLAALPMMPQLIFAVTPPGPINYLLSLSTPRLLALSFLLAFVMRRGSGRPAGFNGLDGAVMLLWLLMDFISLRGVYSLAMTPTSILRVFVESALDWLLPYFLLSRSISRPRDASALIAIIMITGIMLSAVAVFEMLRHWPLYQSMYNHLGIAKAGLSSTLMIRGGFMRAPGPFLGSTTFAVFLALSAIATIISRRQFRSRLHHAAASAVLMAGLLAASSRGGLLAFIGGLAVLQLYKGKVGRLTMIGALGVAGYGGARILAGMIPRLGEYLGFQGAAAGTADYRVDLLRTGMSEALNHPLLGSGAHELVDKLNSLVQGQGIVDFVNTYLYIALFSGVVGLIVFLSSIAILGRWLIAARARIERNPQWREWGWFVVAGGGAFLANMLVQSLSERNPMWLGLLLALGRALQSVSRTNVRPSAPSEHSVALSVENVGANT